MHLLQVLPKLDILWAFKKYLFPHRSPARSFAMNTFFMQRKFSMFSSKNPVLYSLANIRLQTVPRQCPSHGKKGSALQTCPLWAPGVYPYLAARLWTWVEEKSSSNPYTHTHTHTHTLTHTHVRQHTTNTV